MEFDFGIFHRTQTYHEARVAMLRLPRKESEEVEGIADFDDDVLTYCIAGARSKPNIVFEEYEDKLGPLLTAKELTEAQASNVLCQNHEEILWKEEQLPSTKKDCFAEVRPVMGWYKLLFPNVTVEHYFTIGIAQHWMDI